MGKKKAFIDKKRATTYSLVFRSAEDLEEPENAEADRVLVPAGEFGGGTKEDQPPSDPRALYAHFFGNEDYEQEEMTEARRRELLEYGFPDDGYDYLKHCRVIGRGSAAMHAHQIAAAAAADPSAPSSSAAAAAAAAEPSQAVFLKAPRVKAPRADVKLVDARGVAVAAAIAAATAAEVMPAPAPVLAVDSEAAAPAAAKRIGGRELAAELLELEQLMDAAEAASEPEEADEQGLGDLLDDFVLTAAAGAAVDTGIVAAAAAAPGSTRQQQQQQFDFSDEDEEFSSELSDDEEQQQQHNRMAVAGSSGPAATAVAGSGKAAYDMLNEQFDHLMSAYDDEQLGDLEGDARAAGKLRPDQLQALIAQGQQQQQQQRLGPARAAANGELQSGDADDDYEENDKFLVDETTGVGFKGRKIGGLGFESKVESLAEKDDEVIAAVRARLAAQEATANSSSKKGAAGGILEDEELQTMYMPAERERWDCESVLSLRSNISHFPAKIASEAGGRRRGGSGAVAAAAAAAGGSGVIKLNAKTGLPSGYGAASMAAAAAAAAASAAAAAGAQQQRLTSAAVAAAAAAAGNDADSEGPAAQGFDNCSTATSIYERLKGETAEERKARKAAVKAVQRDARATKKELKKMYASEASRQQRQQAAAPKAAVIPIP